MAQRSESAAQTFLFADLSGFTALTEAHGDEQAADLVGGFCGAVRQLLAAHQAQEVKTIGDALMLRTGDAAAAIRLGLGIVHDVGAQHGFPLVRVGMPHRPSGGARGRLVRGNRQPGGPRLGCRRWRGGAADRRHQGRR
jgi:class 3 adenylate cyclase